MIFRIESERTNLITAENLEYAIWLERLDQLKSVVGFKDQSELLTQLKVELELDEEQLVNITACISDNSTAKYFRYFKTNAPAFKIEPVYLNLNRFEGKLIYWKDWDYFFYKNRDNFCLWVYIGGMSDMWQKIILSKPQIENYKTIGISEIDYLVKDIRNWKTSIEYEKAQKENRIIL